MFLNVTCMSGFYNFIYCTDRNHYFQITPSSKGTEFFSSPCNGIFFFLSQHRCAAMFFLSLFFFKSMCYGTSSEDIGAASVLFSHKSLQRTPTINANREHFVTQLYTSCLKHVRISQTSRAWVWVADGAKSRKINTVKTSPCLVLCVRGGIKPMHIHEFWVCECLIIVSWKSNKNSRTEKEVFFMTSSCLDKEYYGY